MTVRGGERRRRRLVAFVTLVPAHGGTLPATLKTMHSTKFGLACQRRADDQDDMGGCWIIHLCYYRIPRVKGCFEAQEAYLAWCARCAPLDTFWTICLFPSACCLTKRLFRLTAPAPFVNFCQGWWTRCVAHCFCFGRRLR